MIPYFTVNDRPGHLFVNNLNIICYIQGSFARNIINSLKLDRCQKCEIFITRFIIRKRKKYIPDSNRDLSI